MLARCLKIFAYFSLSIALANTAFAANSGITYQGRILRPDGSPLSGANTQFKLQIRTPDANNCLMYEEVQSQDLRNSNGQFSLTINDGTGARTDATGFGLDRIFANRGTFTFDPTTCASGSSYATNTGDGRMLAVLFKDETMTAWEPIPPAKINFVPFAFESKQIAGFTADSLLRVVNGSGDPLTGLAPLSNAQYTALLDLANGSSTAYTKSGQLNGVSLPSMSAGEVLGWNGSAWVSTTSTPGAASVTTAMLQNNAVDATKIANGAIGTTQVASNVTINTSGTVGAAITTTRDFKLYAASPSTFAIDMQAPALAASYNLVWPLDDGNNGEVLTTNGSGVMSWAPAAASSQWTNHAANISYDGGGKVGIGTTAPTAELEVAGQANASAFAAIGGSASVRPGLYLSNTATTAGSGTHISFNMNGTPLATIGNLVDTTTTDSSLTFATRQTSGTPAERMRISANGSVGIGTTAPTAVLELKAGTATAGTAPLKFTSGTLLSTPEDGAVEYNSTSGLYLTIGNTRYVIPTNSAAGNYSNVSNISNASGSITMTPSAGNSVTINQSTTSTNSTSGALVVTGGVGIGGAVNAAGNIASGGSISATTNVMTPQLFGSSTASGNIKIDGTSNATPGNVYLATNVAGGKVGIGTTVPGSTLDVKGSLRLSGSTSGYVGFQPAAAAGSTTYTLPAADGTLGYYLGTNGSGTLSWYSPTTQYNNTITQVSYITPYTSTSTTAASPIGASTTVYNLDTTTGDGAFLKLQTNARTGYIGAISNGAAATQSMVFGQQTGTTAYNEFVRIDGTGNVGIGTTSPAGTLHVSSSAGATVLVDGYGSVPQLSGRFANGTPAAPTAVQVNDTLFFSGARGYTGSAFTSTSAAGMYVLAAQNWTPTAVGASISFETTPNGSTTRAERVRITNGGDVGIGTSLPTTKLDVVGTIRSVGTGGASTANASAAIDWSKGNNQSLSAACTATTFTNMSDGATYNLAVTDSSATTCTFSQAGLTFLFTPANGSRILGQQTLYSFTRIGSYVYVAWATMQ